MTREHTIKGVTYESKASYKRIAKRRKQFGAMKARNWKALREAERDGNVQAIIDAATYAIRFYNNGARFPQTIRHAFQFGHSMTAANPKTFWPILIELWGGYDWMCCEDMWWLDILIRIMADHKPGSGHEYIAEGKRTDATDPSTERTWTGRIGFLRSPDTWSEADRLSVVTSIASRRV